MQKTIRRKRARPDKFTAPCPQGLASLLAAEIRAFGGSDVVVESTAVHWQGNLETGYRACLWSRYASRVLLHVHEFSARDDHDLYRALRAVDWDRHHHPTTTFAVGATVRDGFTSHSRYLEQRVKDAIVDHCLGRHRVRPRVDRDRPRVRFHLHLDGATGVLSFDLAGVPLNRRGYRTDEGPAAIKENLAAALITLSGWPEAAATGAPLFDPMCGGGTLLIEAALIHGDVAPGLNRRHFGFLAWPCHDPALWSRLLEEALAREEAGQNKPWPRIAGWDRDPEAVAKARANIRGAGLEDRIQVTCRPLGHWRPETGEAERVWVVLNPPYGRRLHDAPSLRYLYRGLGRRVREALGERARIGLITSDVELADQVHIDWERVTPVRNGPIACRFYVGRGYAEPEPGPRIRLHPFELDEGRDLANRLRKNYERLLPFLRRHGLEAFRLYDRDIPAYNLVVDVYGHFVHVQEFEAPGGMDPEVAKARFRLALEVLRALFCLRRQQVIVKTRRRQRGKAQYQRRGKSGRPRVVREGDLAFLVNLTDYLDTGLFLDHRATRRRIREGVRERRFLNLFSYTGAATVAAAAGGAGKTVSVDASATYLEWTAANLALNGFAPEDHQLTQADVLRWLAAHERRYGLIFVDPPTFSNNRHEKRLFDIRRHHERLLRLAMDRLEEDGVLLFSTNSRKFSLAPALAQDFHVEEITDATIDPVCRRPAARPPAHRCYLFRHAANSGRQR